MRRCPVADYLGTHSAADLCAGSWCNLDYALAEMWGATPQRSGTLAGGAECCDFRFRITSSEIQCRRTARVDSFRSCRPSAIQLEKCRKFTGPASPTYWSPVDKGRSGAVTVRSASRPWSDVSATVLRPAVDVNRRRCYRLGPLSWLMTMSSACSAPRRRWPGRLVRISVSRSPWRSVRC